MDIFKVALLLIVIVGLLIFIEHEDFNKLTPIPVTGENAQICEGNYTLTKKDRLDQIAYRCHLSTSEILKVNPDYHDISDFQPGDTISLPGSGKFPGVIEEPAPSMPDTAANNVFNNTEYREYTVRGEDTLESIARTQKANAQDIRNLNPCLANDTRVVSGQVLLLPKK